MSQNLSSQRQNDEVKFGQTKDGLHNNSFITESTSSPSQKNDSNTISYENLTVNGNRYKSDVNYLWKKINLLGCITVLQEVYGSTLIHGHGFLAIELGLCAFILIEIAALAIAFAYAVNTPSTEYGIPEQDDEEQL